MAQDGSCQTGMLSVHTSSDESLKTQPALQFLLKALIVLRASASSCVTTAQVQETSTFVAEAERKALLAALMASCYILDVPGQMHEVRQRACAASLNTLLNFTQQRSTPVAFCAQSQAGCCDKYPLRLSALTKMAGRTAQRPTEEEQGSKEMGKENEAAAMLLG